MKPAFKIALWACLLLFIYLIGSIGIVGALVICTTIAVGIVVVSIRVAAASHLRAMYMQNRPVYVVGGLPGDDDFVLSMPRITGYYIQVPHTDVMSVCKRIEAQLAEAGNQNGEKAKQADGTYKRGPVRVHGFIFGVGPNGFGEIPQEYTDRVQAFVVNDMRKYLSEIFADDPQRYAERIAEQATFYSQIEF
jgi:hypothetical protein